MCFLIVFKLINSKILKQIKNQLKFSIIIFSLKSELFLKKIMFKLNNFLAISII